MNAIGLEALVGSINPRGISKPNPDGGTEGSLDPGLVSFVFYSVI